MQPINYGLKVQLHLFNFYHAQLEAFFYFAPFGAILGSASGSNTFLGPTNTHHHFFFFYASLSVCFILAYFGAFLPFLGPLGLCLGLGLNYVDS